MTEHAHEYRTRLIWDGNKGDGTTDYERYGRQYRVQVRGKPDLTGSADPVFRGDADRHNPEDLFVAAISACHMLSYLALCARKRVSVLSYEDEAHGTMKTDASGGGSFEQVTLHPVVTIAGEQNLELARRLHEKAHEVCFIANSCNFPIRHEATVRAA